jgi:hypothetical protein
MRAVVCLALVAAACQGSPNQNMLPYPDWNGPAVHARHRGDRGLDVELVAPTGGHTFALGEVVTGPYAVELRFTHQRPAADAIVTQAITTHRVEVPAARLGDARTVMVSVATDGGPLRLALATARP